MRLPSWTWLAIAMLPATFSDDAIAQTTSSATPSDVYIQQSRGHVAPSAKVQSKPTPETATTTSTPTAVGPTAPITCNAQNASSQACYTATQQARPTTR